MKLRLPRQLKKLYPERDHILEKQSMPLVRQIEILLYDAYQDTTLTTTQLMSTIIVCVMYLRARALPDYLRDKMVTSVDFAEHILAQQGLKNPRTLETWDLPLALANPKNSHDETLEKAIDDAVDEFEVPDDLSGLDDPPLG